MHASTLGFAHAGRSACWASRERCPIYLALTKPASVEMTTSVAS